MATNPTNNQVDHADRCPRCSERDADMLVWTSDGAHVTCTRCGTHYRPGDADAVLEAAKTLLERRQADMLTLEEHVALARAVGRATGKPTAHYLTEQDLEDIAVDYPELWNEPQDGALP